MSETCKTCAFWKQEPPIATDPDTDAYYERWDRWDTFATYDLAFRDPLTHREIAPPFPIGQCTVPKLAQLARPETPDAFAVLDGSGYAAVLFTGPEFGCVHWAPHAPSPDAPTETP